MKNSIVSLIAGSVFGLGLTLSGMTNPDRVKGFSNFTGQWDSRLAYVMISALLVSISLSFFILKRKKPILDTVFHIPYNSKIDSRLIIGSIIFGFGLALTGLCPATALASMTRLDQSGFIFLLSMIASMTFSETLAKY